VRWVAAFIALIDEDVSASFNRRGFGILIPRLGWVKLVTPVLILALPLAMLTGRLLTIYIAIWSALVLGFFSVYFWRFAKAQDVRMNSAFTNERKDG
jgi:hypothetical protein